MSQADELNKLYDLKVKGLISDSEFEATKQKILNTTLKQIQTTVIGTTEKSRLIYVVLAFFLGMLGIHNFYADRTGRAVAQLLITLLLWWLFIPLIAVWIWVLVDVLTVKTDGNNKPMQPTSPIVIGIIFFLLLFPAFSLFIGGMAGFTMATNRYQATAVYDTAEKYANLAHAYKNANHTTQIPSMTELGLPQPDFDDCTIIIPQNGISVTSVRVDIDCSANPQKAEEIGKLVNATVINGKLSHRFEIK